jgi:hypothetical protein
VYVQALVSKGSVERFDEAIVRWLAGSAEVDPHSMMIRPEIEHAPRKFAPIVRKDTLRRAALCNQRVTHLDNVLTSQLFPDLYRQSLAAKDVDDRQSTKALPVRQLIGNPPLRQRPEDIVPLAESFLLRHAAGRPRQLSEAALEALRRARWPGNARELENVIERSLALTDKEKIGTEELIFEEPEEAAPDALREVLESAADLETPLKQLEGLYVAEVLRRTGGNKTQAARILEVNRTTLYRRGD